MRRLATAVLTVLLAPTASATPLFGISPNLAAPGDSHFVTIDRPNANILSAIKITVNKVIEDSVVSADIDPTGAGDTELRRLLLRELWIPRESDVRSAAFPGNNTADFLRVDKVTGNIDDTPQAAHPARRFTGAVTAGGRSGISRPRTNAVSARPGIFSAEIEATLDP